MVPESIQRTPGAGQTCRQGKPSTPTSPIPCMDAFDYRPRRAPTNRCTRSVPALRSGIGVARRATARAHAKVLLLEDATPIQTNSAYPDSGAHYTAAAATPGTGRSRGSKGARRSFMVAEQFTGIINFRKPAGPTASHRPVLNWPAGNQKYAPEPHQATPQRKAPLGIESSATPARGRRHLRRGKEHAVSDDFYGGQFEWQLQRAGPPARRPRLPISRNASQALRRDNLSLPAVPRRNRAARSACDERSRVQTIFRLDYLQCF